MKRACVIVCSNGLGHIRRVLPVVQALLGRESSLEVNIACAAWQLNALSRWAVLQSLRCHPRAMFQLLESYPRWSLQREHYESGELLTWHAALKPLGLDRYDLVVSDNLVEALIYQPRTVLMGSFLWHDVYATHFSEDTVVREYWKRSTALLEEHTPPMIANRYFAMSAVREQTRAVEVGMLPSVVTHHGKQSREPGILCLGSSIAPAEELMRAFTKALSSAVAGSGTRLFVDQRLARDLAPSNGFALFDHDVDDFDRIDAVVARPGLGIITDCVTVGTPLLCMYEPNVEMEHNARVLESLGLGRTLQSADECIHEVRSFIGDERARETYRDCADRIDRRGLEQTIDYLTSYVE